MFPSRRTKASGLATGGGDVFRDEYSLEFDGSNDSYTIDDVVISDQEAYMIFVVVDPDSVSQKTILSEGATSDFIEFMTTKKIRVRHDNDTAISATFGTVQFPVDEKYVLGIQREAGGTGNINIYKDGSLLTPTSQVADSGPITFNSLSVRNNDRFFDGHIYEMLVYETADLTTSEINKINNYLINKHSPLG